MISALSFLLSAVLAVTPAPSDKLVAKMILVEVAKDGVTQRSSGLSYPGQCKRFQIDAFEEASIGFGLPSAPGVLLRMPAEHADTVVSGRPSGTCWEALGAEDGNAYIEVARFDYDEKLSQGENLRAATALLTKVRAGDVLQMLATYTGGTARGTHTLMFTRPYDPRLDTLYWVDSNFSNHRVDGIRYGTAKAYQTRSIAEVAGWLAWDWHNGATLYRVRDDIVKLP